MSAWQCAATTVVVLTGIAGAQPADPEAPLASVPEPDLDPRSAGYPRGLVDRPLVLPSGTAEGTAIIAVARASKITSASFAPVARYALGQLEIEGALRVSTVKSDRIVVPFVAARFAITPDMTIGAQLGGQLLAHETTDLSFVTPRLLLGRKQLVSEQLAVESQFALGMNFADDDPTYLATGQVRVQWQVAPLVAAEARAALDVRYQKPVAPAQGATLTHSYGIAVVASATPTIDVTPGVDLFVDGDSSLGFVVSVALSARTR